jgi:hypothetical protein
MLALREKKVGPFTVRELPMRDTMRIMKEYPEGNEMRGPALLGAAVYNGSAEPLGLDGVLGIGTSTFRSLMAAHNEVNSAPEFNEGDDEGNA